MKIGSWFILHRDAIGPDDDPYMVRYKLIETPLFAIRVHHIFRSDEDRDLHDHPWSFLSVVLWGGYHEWRPSELRRIGAPSLVFRRAEDLHRLELDQPAWTLVFTGPRCRDWGFQTQSGWVPWQQYLAAEGDRPATKIDRTTELELELEETRLLLAASRAGREAERSASAKQIAVLNVLLAAARAARR